MHILILNWRDIKNPTGGGAEQLTQELAKRWVLAGHQVTQISSLFQDAKKEETIDGVRFIRMGNWWNVHFFAFFYYRHYLKNNVDIIIDEVHWFPFFSNLYAPKKTVSIVCEVANKLFYQLFPYPVALIWRLIEKVYLALYKRVPAMAISKSTYDDLIKEGHIRENLIVLPMGLTIKVKIRHLVKENNPTFIYVARLNRQKGIFEVIKSFATILEKLPHAKLWIVGSASEQVLTQVFTLIDKYGMKKAIVLFGFTTEEKKFELLSKAHVLLSASVQEGWGLTIPEAGLARTPSVVYNTHGFRDIISNGIDGILVKKDPNVLAREAISLYNDKKRYKQMQINAEKKAKSFSWEESAEVSLQFLKKYA